MQELVQSVVINLVAQLLCSLIVGLFSAARQRHSDSASWCSATPTIIPVRQDEFVLFHKGCQLNTLVKLTFMLQFGRIKCAIGARESLKWESFGRVIGAKKLAEYRCNKATVVPADNTVTVTLEGLKSGARVMMQVLCDVHSLESYGQIDQCSTGLRVDEKAIRTPRWGILAVVIACSVFFSTTVYSLIYLYLADYNDAVAILSTLTLSCGIVILLGRRYCLARWYGFWWAFRGRVPLRRIFLRENV